MFQVAGVAADVVVRGGRCKPVVGRVLRLQIPKVDGLVVRLVVGKRGGEALSRGHLRGGVDRVHGIFVVFID